MSKGIFGSMFDFNRDGEMSIGERAAEVAFLQQLMDESEEEEKAEAIEDARAKIECEGLDYDELSMMDELDRADELEAAGLDPDDYEFE